MQRLGYRPALDGVRGIAILLVLGDHFLGIPSGGGYGVDLFFVLSGFLITALLLEELAETGRVSFGAFYARRARRLFPGLAMLLVVFMVIQVARGVNGLPAVAEYGLYFGNVYQAFIGSHATSAHFGLAHLWSLAEEEQFYLVWPLILVALARVRTPAKWLAATWIALTGYRIVLFASGFSEWHLQKSPDTHSTGLILGALAAITRPKIREDVAILAGVGVMFLAFLPFPGYGTTLFEVAAAGITLAAADGEVSITRDLSNRWLVWLGKISYSLYLWHFMLLWAFSGHDRLIVLALSVVVAWLSYRFVELPIRRRRQERGQPVQSMTSNMPMRS